MADIDVYAAGLLSGRLTRQRSKHFFTYTPEASEALSLTMPLRVESYSYDNLHPAFQMNLPEGHLREIIERYTAKRYGSDDLSMLAILGQNHIGRLGYTLAGQALAQNVEPAPNLQSLLNSSDARLFEHLLQRFALKSAVAGVQPKILLDATGSSEQHGKMTLPLKSYIVKSWGEDYPQLACNEFVCLTLCQNAGLKIAPFYLSDNGRLLIMQRFDLTPEGEPLGFEDFCVLQAKSTREKYDGSIESCARTIKQFVSPEHQAQALADFFKLMLINTLIQNGDAHLKNMGVLYHDLQNHHTGAMPTTTRVMAPVFDVVNTTAYIPEDTMALTLAGSKRWPKLKMLYRFARSHCGLNGAAIQKIMAELEHAIVLTQPVVSALRERHPDFDAIGAHISQRMSDGLH